MPIRILKFIFEKHKYFLMRKKNKLILAVLLCALLYLWVELAVGIFFQNSWGGS